MDYVKKVVSACVVILFTCLVIPTKIEIKVNHQLDLPGDAYNPIYIRFTEVK